MHCGTLNVFAQIREITLMNLRNLPSGSVLVRDRGRHCGRRRRLVSIRWQWLSRARLTGAPDRGIVMRGGSNGKSSGIGGRASTSRDGVTLAARTHTIADVQNAAAARRRIWSCAVSNKRVAVSPSSNCRGAQLPNPASRTVPGAAQREFSGIDVGAPIGSATAVADRWLVRTNGGMHESEVWGDVKVAQAAFRRRRRQHDSGAACRPAQIDAIDERLKKIRGWTCRFSPSGILRQPVEVLVHRHRRVRLSRCGDHESGRSSLRSIRCIAQ
jgi:hypothetical protein